MKIIGFRPDFRIAKRTRFARGGFTLIELLVSLTISTMILGVSASVFTATLSSWDRGSQVYETQQIAKTSIDLLERYIRTAILPVDTGEVVFVGEYPEELGGTGFRLTMLSTASGRFPRFLPPTDSSEVSFTYDPDTVEGLILRVDATPDDDPYDGGYAIELNRRIQGFEVLFYNGEEFIEEWTDIALPLAVQVTITVLDENDVFSDMITRVISLPTGTAIVEPADAGGDE